MSYAVLSCAELPCPVLGRFRPPFFVLKMVLLQRNKADANSENHKKLVQAVKKSAASGGGEQALTIGTIAKESFDG